MNQLISNKNLLITTLFCLLSFSLLAESGVSSTIKQVKVYKQKAEITRTVTTKINAGQQEIVLTGIATSINPESLQVEYNNPNSELLSVKHQNNYLTPKVDKPKIDVLQAQVEELNGELGWINDQKVTLKGMEEILNNHKSLSARESGFTPSQVTELISSYKKQLLDIRKELTALSKQEKQIKLERSTIQKQLNEFHKQCRLATTL